MFLVLDGCRHFQFYVSINWKFAKPIA